jgi:hypothetical protein
MGMARLYRKPSLQQQDRLPVATYDQAIRRLVTIRVDASLPDEAYDVAVTLVADIFWATDKRVRGDVIKAAREIGGL